MSTVELNQLAARYAIPPEQVLVLDTSYRAFIYHLNDKRPAAAKNHYQPLQASYYDRNGQLQVFYINCYTGGFPNLKWDRNGSLQRFPPAPQAPADSVLTLPAYFTYLRQPDGQALPPQPASDYTVVVQWNRFMGRQSKRLIKAVRRNATLANKGQRVRLLFVNNDNSMMQLAHPKQRR